MVKVVNIVAGSDVGYELNLDKLHTHFKTTPSVQTHYDPGSTSALQLRFEEGGPLCMIYRTGKFIITGAKNESELTNTYQILLEKFQEIGKVDKDTSDIKIYNKVFTSDLKQNIDLSKLGMYIGYENIEYEPEQAPFLTYRPPSEEGVITLASTGKMVINGIRSKKEAEHIFSKLTEKVESFNSIED
jgi:transcription initiation factor TFIID TATA-box-binding protein